MEQQRPRRTRTIYFIIAILILLASNGIFVYNYFTTDKKLVKTEEELFATDSVKTALDKLLQETDLELDNYKGKNAELDAFLKQKNDSLLEFAHRISILIRQNRVNKDQLDQALEEIDQLRYYKRKSLTQIDSLSNQISLLNRENSGLKSTIDKEKRRNEDLTMENVRLGNKVAIGSKLLTKQLLVTGIKVRSSGKEKLTIKVSQIEKLKVTFLIEPNYVTNPGLKQIFLKVIGPDGGTLYNENSGSGTFKFEGEDARYTAVKEIEFTQEGQAVSIYWEKGSAYQPGEYKVELYCEGMNIGKGSLLLK